ncbi:MAG TPA: hypothetical protein VE779_03165 [Candidatus Angelobacter sp.]|jgi:hypothetical protein|nr:hypothetical protein [Candidatus Angelobacter sp.]
MKRNVFGALMTLVVAFAIATPVVHAQSRITMSANVPFDFTVNGKALPAGAYEVREVGDRATLIETKDGHSKVLGIYQNAEPSKAGQTKLVFHKVGNNYFLAEIWTSARSQGSILPTSAAEKETMAANTQSGGGAETVIVALR